MNAILMCIILLSYEISIQAMDLSLSPLCLGKTDDMIGSPAMYPETNSAANSPALPGKKPEPSLVQHSPHSSVSAHDEDVDDLSEFDFEDDSPSSQPAPILSVVPAYNALLLGSQPKNHSASSPKAPAIARSLPPDESMIVSFGVMMAQQKKMEDPKLTAHRHLVKGVKYFLGTVASCGEEEGDRYILAYRHLTDAVRQSADPVVASWAQIWLFRLHRSKADEQSDEKIREEIKSRGLGFLLEVIKNKKDDETVVTANLLLSRAYALGDGAKRNLELACILADIVHKDRKRFPRHALRACLQCAEGYIHACETSSNFQGIADAEEHLMHAEQYQFEDLRLQADRLHYRLQHIKQRREYARGLAYLREAPCHEDNNIAQGLWEELDQHGLSTLDAVRNSSPGDYASLLARAEDCLEHAVYNDYDPRITVLALEKLDWIYKITHRPNKFELFEILRTFPSYASRRNRNTQDERGKGTTY